MTTDTTAPPSAPAPPAPVPSAPAAKRHWSRVPIYLIILIIIALWTIPSLGLLINSFRPDPRVSGWWTAFSGLFDGDTWTLANYREVAFDRGFDSAFWNTLAVAVPSTAIPVTIALFAAYAFSWMNFRGRHVLFVLVVGLMVVPLQMSLIPILRIYTRLDWNGTFPGLWMAHTGFGLPLAIYLLRNYIGSLPSSLIESAKIDGADHFHTLTRLIIPLSVPVLASFAIFQFLWVWNDYLVALVFLGIDNADVRVLTVSLSGLAGRGEGALTLLPAAAFLSMVVPLAVFFSMQRFFVRGLTAGSVKG